MKRKSYKFVFITLFPELINHYFGVSIVARAIAKKLLAFKVLNLRSFGLGTRQVVDGTPYGGGAGMVLRSDVVVKAIQKAKKSYPKSDLTVVLLTPSGKPLNQDLVKKLAKKEGLVFVCGRYEGFDERVSKFVDIELSIGDYVLMGGELPALVVAEAVLRHVPGVLGKQESLFEESFTESMLEYPQYTKPEKWKVESGKWKGKTFSVPKVLLTGHHENIEAWREKEALKKTKRFRSDLLGKLKT